jgi:hypothetical protein
MSIAAPTDTDCKALATLRAQLGIRGHAVHCLDSGGYLVVDTKWAGLCKALPDLAALAAFAKQLGARA